ncbi:hypothetical protein J6590_039744, partial [Homalodisca vitripennis]
TFLYSRMEELQKVSRENPYMICTYTNEVFRMASGVTGYSGRVCMREVFVLRSGYYAIH